VSALIESDLAMFAKLRVASQLLERAQITRVTDPEARELLGLNGASGSFAGIRFQYRNPITGYREGDVIRRDTPEIESGKPRRKYMTGYGNRSHLYTGPGAAALLDDSAVPVAIVESPKSVLALEAWSERTGNKILPLACNGCWGWRGKIGKAETATGQRVDEHGPLPELLEYTKGRTVYIIFDANAATNADVRAARKALAATLGKLKETSIRVVDLPIEDGVNGPDDYLAAHSDDDFLRLLEGGVSVTKGGSPRPNLNSALAMLRTSPEWKGVLAFNEFSLHVTSKKPAPWQTAAGNDWGDYDDSRATEWLQQHDVNVNTPVTAEAVQTLAKQNSFHPVRQYLSGLQWDRTSRLDSWLNIYLGVPDSAFARAAGSRWLVSAVARIFQPGCQADYTLLLEGPQGIRKSTALQILAGDKWFTDHISDLGSKDSRIELHGKWIIEFSELGALRRSEIERWKAFLTARVDHFRQPYGRRTEAVPRSCVFAATTNDETPFTDSTGNRRFWPVRCGVIDTEALKRDRDQIWAEAYLRYTAGEPWWLETAELNKAACVEQNERYEPGVWDDLILDWVQNPSQKHDATHETPIPLEPYESDATRVTVVDVLLHCIGRPLDRQTQGDRNQVARCLRRAGWTHKQSWTGQSRGKWFYWAPNATGAIGATGLATGLCYRSKSLRE
jgi:predicted P-loop ATPase